MVSAIIAFGIALATVIAVTPVVRRLALDVGAVDRPGARRVHERVIPRLGGLAVAVAFFTPLLVLFGIETEVARRFFAEPLRIVGLAGGALIVITVGVFDDVRGVRAWHKLWGQVGAAALAFLCGFRIEAVSVPGFGQLDMGIFALPVTVLWIVAIVNAVNLIDGLDGLAGGVAFFACVTNFVVAALNGSPLVMLLSASLGGAVMGFLLFNFNPASIFMGDSGSLFLGFVLGTTAILGASIKSSTTVAILVPLIALGLPIMDTLLAMVRRFLERRPIFSPDRGHIHHQLLAMGINHRRAVLILYGLSVLFTVGAILLSVGRNWQVGGALLVLSVAVIGVLRAMGNLHVALRRWRRHVRVRPLGVERLRGAVPIALQRISTSPDASALPTLLGDFAETACLLGVQLIDSDPACLAPFEWASDAPENTAEQEAVSAVYPLEAAGAEARLRFAWLTDQGDVPPEADILLQLVVDACNARLGRLEVARRRVSSGYLRPI